MKANITLTLPSGSYSGYIFDCDGTLLHSMPTHLRSWNQSIRDHGGSLVLTPERFMKVAGVGGIDTVNQFNEWSGDELPPRSVFEHKEEIYLQMLNEVELIEEVVAIARSVARHATVSVASGGPRFVVEKALESAGLRSLFPVVITQDDIQKSKPDPEIFLLAAERMGVPPAQCVVFEDSPLGIAGAEAAGMASVEIPNLLLR